MMMTDVVPPEELRPHPKNVEMYGDPELPNHFLEDVRSHGITTPVTVTEDSHFTNEGGDTLIISGHRRVAAAAETDRSVPIGAYKTFDTQAEEIAAIIRANDYRDKTFSQQMAEADAIREVELLAANDRMENPLQNFAEGDSGLSRDKIAERIGIGSGETYRKAKKVWDAAMDGDERASKLVDGIDNGNESIHSAYTTLRDRDRPTSTDNNDTDGDSDGGGRVRGIQKHIDAELSLDLKALLLQCRDEEVLSARDIELMKEENPVSIVSWLLTERELHVIGSPGLPEFGWDGDDVSDHNSTWIERTTIHTSQIRTDWFEELGDGYDEDLAGLYAQLHEDSSAPPAMVVPVAPMTDGSFHLLDFAQLNEIRAIKERNVDGYFIPAQVMNVRGDSLPSVTRYAIWKDEWERQWDRDTTREEFVSAVNGVVEDHPDSEEWATVVKDIDEVVREANQEA